MRLLASILANALALFFITRVLDGFQLEGGWIAPILAAGVITLLNFILKPLLKFLTFPVIFLTGGLFLIVLNAIILYVTDYLIAVMDIQGMDMIVDGVLTYLIAAVIFGLANWLIHWFLKAK